jgi:hypothetical protein
VGLQDFVVNARTCTIFSQFRFTRIPIFLSSIFLSVWGNRRSSPRGPAPAGSIRRNPYGKRISRGLQGCGGGRI